MTLPGAPIDLRWDGRPEFWVVRGHVAESEALDWARDWCEGYDEPLPTRGFTVRHEWARWSFAGFRFEFEDPPHHELRLYREPGRGRFPVTVAYDADELFSAAENRRERASADARVRAAVAKLYPEAEVIETGLYENWGARLRFPGGQGRVTWQEGVDHVLVEQRDVDAWHAYRGSAA